MRPQIRIVTDGIAHDFPRTPSFAWRPVPGALRYEFELATSRTFTGGAIIWSNVKADVEEPTTTTAPTTTAPTTPATPAATTPAATTVDPTKPASVYDNLRSPAVALDLSLPWITGNPYALYAHVRAVTKDGATPWSMPFGLNIRWGTVPADLDSAHSGLVRWSPVEGATSYEVWIFGAKRTFRTTTNVADLRDLYTFRRPAWSSTVRWRVRAQRSVYGEVASGIPSTSNGPWSPIYSDVQLPPSLGPLTTHAAVSDTTSTQNGTAHALSRGFAFGGDRGGLSITSGASPPSSTASTWRPTPTASTSSSGAPSSAALRTPPARRGRSRSRRRRPVWTRHAPRLSTTARNRTR